MVDIHFDDREKLVMDITKMLEEGSSNDVQIKLSDGVINANKDVLMIRSEYFQKMFKNNFMESKENIVDFSHISRVVMETILKFLFSGTVSFNNLSLLELIEMTQVCDMMLNKSLQEQVVHFIIFELLPDSGSSASYLPTLLQGLKVADEFKLSSIEDAIIEELYFNIWGLLHLSNEDNQNSNAFKRLPFRMLKKIILCKKEDVEVIKMVSNKDRLKAFVLWSSFNACNEEVMDIAKSFDIEEFSVEELLTYVKESRLFTTVEIDKRILYLAKQNKMKMGRLRVEITKLNGILPIENMLEIEKLIGSGI